MVYQSTHRRRQPAPCGEDQMDNPSLRAPIRQYVDQLPLAEGIGAYVIGQECHAQTCDGGSAHGTEITACHARFVAEVMRGTIIPLKTPIDLANVIAGAKQCHLLRRRACLHPAW